MPLASKIRLQLNRVIPRYGRASIFVVLAVACIGWGLYAAIDAIRPPASVHLRLAAGSSVARRFQIVKTFASEARQRDLFVEVVATTGFEDSIRQLSEGKLDLAAVSSGLEISECKNVRVLAGLDSAPLHILVRRELAEQGLSLIESIKGRRISLGQPGTNDYLLAHDVVRFLRLSPIDDSGQGDYTELTLSKEELSELAQDIQSQSGQDRQVRLRDLPDVVMTVASLPGMLVQRLLDTGEYCLVPFPNVEPFLATGMPNAGEPGGSVDRLLVEPTVIHPGMYLGNSLMPSSDCPTVGLHTLLVARADLPSAAVNRVMQSVFETDFMRRVKPTSPREIPTVYDIHPAAEAYLDRDKPLITGTFFELLSKFLSIFGAFSAGALSLYSYLRRRRIRRPGEYLEEIRKIDALALGQQPDTDAPLTADELANQLESRLTQLKEQVIHDYCNNRVQGEMVLLSVLSILADSRMQLRIATERKAVAGSIAPNEQAWQSSDPERVQGPGQISGRAA